MITRKMAHDLLQGTCAPSEFTMYHGTTAKAIVEMLKTGTLPNRIMWDSNRNRDDGSVPDEHPLDKGYMFFAPIKHCFVGHPIYDILYPEPYEYVDPFFDCQIYARLQQQYLLLEELCGTWPSGFVTDYFPGECMDREFEFEWEVEKFRKLADYGADRLWDELSYRKGVCAALSQKVFELEIEPGADAPEEEVMIHLPTGLPIKYIGKIIPLGDFEWRQITDWIEKELPD
ncbi:hypothetical protein KY320_03325 [Candidatus Woesearchaeota archaeon]|nr:hypothetical protein [Candidatus Woesearchaeota archaeon]